MPLRTKFQRHFRRKIEQFVRELNPAYWPLGAFVLVHDTMQYLLHSPTTSYSYTRSRFPTQRSLAIVMEWITRAQDASQDGGIAAYASLYGGFGPSYPETTGYLIPTLIDYGTMSGDWSYVERAVRAADWLVGLQSRDGAFPGGFALSSDGPSVFNTGQILFGLLAVFQRTGDEKYRRAALRAGQWLVSVQSSDGSWQQYTYEGKSHVYYTMVSWALAELYRCASWPAGRCPGL